MKNPHVALGYVLALALCACHAAHPPSAPSSVTATRGDTSASVSWTAPESGKPILTYRITASPGGATATTAGATSANVSGLMNGTAYTFTVAATNASGTGPESAPSAPVIPAGVPAAPASVTSTGGVRAAAVGWAAADANGSAVTAYTVTASPGGAHASTTGATSATVTGLDNGTAYTFTVVALNAIGPSAGSAPSAPARTIALPDAPAAVTAARGDGSAAVSWTAPAVDGGAPITAYLVTASPGGATATTAGATTATVSGLVNGTAYTFTVAASNAAGQGAPSAASAPVTPLGLPGAPTGATATPSVGSATVTWTAPASDGGSAVLSYLVMASPGTATATSASTSATLSGLTAGTQYTFTVAATNVVGTGAASAPSAPVTPVAWTHGGPGGGTINSVSSDPFDVATAWVVVQGFIFRSRDTGATWTESDAGIISAGQTAGLVVADRTLAGRLYAMTNLPQPPCTSGCGAPTPASYVAFWRSDDRGDTWTEIDDGSFPAGINFLRALADGSIVGCGSGFTRSASGVSWTAPTALANNAYCQSISDDPAHAGVLYAGVTGTSSVYTSADSGVTWAPTATAPYDTAYSSGSSQKSAVAVSTDGAKVYSADWAVGLFVSSDAGATWAPMGAGTPWSYCPEQLAVDARTGALVLTDCRDGGVGGRLSVSTDGGATWTERTSAGTLELWSLSVAASASATTVWTAGRAGAFASSDLGVTFGATGAGLYAEDAQGGFELDLSTPGSLWFANSVGEIFHTADAGQTWTRKLGTFGQPPNAFVATAGGTALLQSGSYSVRRSTDGGTTWTEVATFYAYAFAVDGQTVYAGTSSQGIQKSIDGGATWAATSVSSGVVSALWTAAGRVYYLAPAPMVSSDGGQTFTSIAGDLDLAAVSPYALLPHPDDATRLWLIGAPGILYTTDGGAHWLAAAVPAADTSFGPLATMPGSPQRVWAVGNADLLYSSDGGAHFAALPGYPGGFSQLAIDANGKAYAAGSGLWFCSSGGL